MELSLEGILETLLVGAIASLCLLSILFLCAGHVLRLSAVQSLFRFLLYENPSEFPSTGALEPQMNAKEHIGVPSAFVMLLLIASMFGLGIITESFSDLATNKLGETTKFFSDPGIRADAFSSVVGTQVRATGSELSSRRVADKPESASSSPDARDLYVLQGLAQLLADSKACAGVYGERDPEQGSPCAEVRERVNDFYYLAKNSVFQDETYFRELSQLQSRIDFTRSAGHSLLLLSLVFGIIAAFAAAIEAVPDRDAGVARSRWASWLSRLRPPADRRHGWRQHVLNLSATRVWIICGVSLLGSVLTVMTWHDTEKKFDKRVFGYFLCCSDHRADTLEAVRSSYRVFRGIAGTKFEPSSILWLGERQSRDPSGARTLGDYVLVANDKDTNAPFAVYQVGDDGRLGLRAPLRFFDTHDQPVVEPLFGKIEAMEMIADGPRGQQTIYAIGMFSGAASTPGALMLYAFRLGNGVPGELPVEVTATSLGGDAAPAEGSSPAGERFFKASIATTAAGRRANGIILEDPEKFCWKTSAGKEAEASCDVEGMAAVRGELYLGLRGRRAKGAPVEVAAELLRVKLQRAEGQDALQVERGLLAQRLSITLPEEFVGFGVSGLEANRMSGNPCDLLVLTSCEVHGAVSEAVRRGSAVNASRRGWGSGPPLRCDENHPRFRSSRQRIAEVQGALWSVTLPHCKGEVPKHEKSVAVTPNGSNWMLFAHKPEGLTVVDASIGAALVVFDDDGSRKGINAVPDTFPLRQEESVFARIKLPSGGERSP